uniref:ribonuclease H n=1 Tax=Hucho hucho TaxID=62062 RepID=A0A4W5LMV1_9TELE
MNSKSLPPRGDQPGSTKVAPTVGVSGHRQVQRPGSITALSPGSPDSSNYGTATRKGIPKGEHDRKETGNSTRAHGERGGEDEVSWETEKKERPSGRKRKRLDRERVSARENRKADEKCEVCITIPSENLQCVICGAVAKSTYRLVGHLNSEHKKVKLIYKCMKCGRESEKRHSIACHAPKCKGPQNSPAGKIKIFACQACPRKFATANGLAQHVRHNHRDLCNRERIQQETKRECSRKAGKKWTPGEVRALRKLNTKYGSEQSPARLIAEGLGTNTSSEQVRYKRRRLKLEQAKGGTDKEWEDVIAGLVKPADPPLTIVGLSDTLRKEMQKAIERPEAGKKGEEEDGNGEMVGDLERVAANMVEEMGCKRKKRKARWRRADEGGVRKRPKWVIKRRAKMVKFRQYQELFKKNKGRLGEMIMDGSGKTECEIPIEAIEESYKALWGGVVEFRGLGQFSSSNKADNSKLGGLISPNEVKEKLSAIKKGSAAGPDGIRKEKLLSWDPEGVKLAQIFSSWLASGRIPEVFKQGRTTLLPKTLNKDDLLTVSGWRPITIGSMVLRLFSKIITGRLEGACMICPRQRGFIAAPGCAENLMILNGILSQSKKERVDLAIVFIDFAKAFDSVSHEHLMYVLRERELDEHMIGLIEDSYKGVHTQIEMKGVSTNPIEMKKGVKQGDPMSPLLFNLAIDPLLQQLELNGEGYAFKGQNITTLAFADDLVLMSGSWAGMQQNIKIVEVFCKLSGLRVQPKKCHGFMIRSGSTAFTINNCQAWTIGGEKLHLIDPEKSEKYLGMKVNPWLGVAKPEAMEQITEWAKKIGTAPLKPSQKVEMFNSYAIPRLVYGMNHGDVGTTKLAAIDRVIKTTIKRWLHLPMSTCDGLLYARGRDGGLCITKLASVVPAMQVRRTYALSLSSDPLVREVTAYSVPQGEYAKLWLRAGGEQDQTPILGGQLATEEKGTDKAGRGGNDDGSVPRRTQSCKKPSNWRLREFEGWAALPVQGTGIEMFLNDGTSNGWLADPAKVCFNQRQYMAALQVRANVYPTREALARGRNKTEAKCRRCDHKLETVSHILGQCNSVKAARIRRHDLICELLTGEAVKCGWTVSKEVKVKTPEGRLRIPDLVMVKGDKGVIVDVTVRFERNEDSLEKGRKEKVEKYLPIAPLIAEQFRLRRVLVYGFPMGARGKWPTSNFEVLKTLGVSRARSARFASLASRRALLYSLDILKAFGLECSIGREEG